MNYSEAKAVPVTLGLLALSGILVLGAQLRVAAIEKRVIKAQSLKLAEGVTSVRTLRTQVNEALEQRTQQVAVAEETEKRYAAFLTDLLELAKVDPDAKAVTLKWKIQSNEAPASVGTAAPSTDTPPGATDRSAPSGKPGGGPSGAAVPANQAPKAR